MMGQTINNLIITITAASIILCSSIVLAGQSNLKYEELSPEDKALFDEMISSKKRNQARMKAQMEILQKRAKVALKCRGYYYGSFDGKWEGKARGAFRLWQHETLGFGNIQKINEAIVEMLEADADRYAKKKRKRCK